jgi:serine/threonine protein kinase
MSADRTKSDPELIQAQKTTVHDPTPSPDPVPLPHELSGDRPGTWIGSYRLLEKIGEGGMGVVFLAEQIEPVRRRVALKLIKVGMDTAKIVARFEAEKQALALMDHLNIAKVLDAGTTRGGCPIL